MQIISHCVIILLQSNKDGGENTVTTSIFKIALVVVLSLSLGFKMGGLAMSWQIEAKNRNHDGDERED